MAEERARRTRSATSATVAHRRVENAEDAARRATESLSGLIGHRAQGCSEVSPTDDGGWLVCVDVVEVARIPDTTSLLATYEVELSEDGSLRRYRRVRRYRRGAADT
jgi:hypothetical protein